MIVYLLLVLFLFVSKNTKNKALIFFGGFLLILISSIRGLTVGTDTISYMAEYQQVNMLPWKMSDLFSTREPLFHLLYKLLGDLGLSYRWAMFVQTIVFLCPIMIVVAKTKENAMMILLFMVLLGFYFFSFNGVRQGIAISFCFLAYDKMEKKEYLISLMLILIAFGFHQTSLIVLIVFGLAFLNLDNIWLTVLIIVAYIFPWFVDINPYIMLLFESESVDMFQRYAIYATGDYSMMDRLPVFQTIKSAMFVYFIWNSSKEERKSDVFFKVSLLAVIISNISFGLPSYVGRIFYYFDIAFIVSLVRIYGKNLLSKIIIIGFALLYFIHFSLINGRDGILPYIIG